MKINLWLPKLLDGKLRITRGEARHNLRHLNNDLIDDLLKGWEMDGLIKRKRMGGIIEVDRNKYFL
jgi:hypothetical protein